MKQIIAVCIGLVVLISGCGHQEVKRYRMLVSSDPIANGEAQVVQRIIKAASNLGWDAIALDNADRKIEAVQNFKPDFMISLRHEVKPLLGIPSFLYLHLPMSLICSEINGEFKKNVFPKFLDYDGYLLVNPNVDPIVKAFHEENTRSFLAIKTVLSTPSNEFVKTPKQRLCYVGDLWDKARREAYFSVYQKLDRAGYFDVYGKEKTWKSLNLKSYRGGVPFDDHSLQDTFTKAGVVLVLHSHQHLKEAVPTGRIFEAAASSAVIISDKHPFIIKHFGDTVLYVDNRNPEEMFNQIDAHMKWILLNPKEAVGLAKRSHAIFKENFTLEKELRKIGEFYEEFKCRKK
jgi:hypothetical protein